MKIASIVMYQVQVAEDLRDFVRTEISALTGAILKIPT